MSVFVKGMEMPTSCEGCDFGYPFRNYIGDGAYNPSGYYCRRLKRLINEYKSIPDNCPLAEVPTPHGRLIDADDLRQKMYHKAFETESNMQKWDSGCWIRYKMFEEAETNASTIIEAEG